MKKQLFLFTLVFFTLTFKIQQETISTAVALMDPQQCIQEKCPNQWAACQKDPKCIPALQDCQKKCGTKASCWTFCLPSKGSQPAIDVAKCAQANNCLGQQQKEIVISTALALMDPQQCIQQNCPSQWAACQKDPKCVPALQDCQKKCGSKASCWEFCLPGKGSQAAIDVAKCAQAHNCMPGQQKQVIQSTAVALNDPIIDCVKQKCPNQWAACQKDSKCLPTIEDCQKKCGTKQTCWQFCLGSKGDTSATNVAKCAVAQKCIQSKKEQIETAN